MTSTTPDPRADRNRWNHRHFLLIGYTALFVLVFGIGAWAAVTQIAGAVVSSGIIEVEGNRQVVQHPDGGVIAEIDARDGDEVAAGDVLVRLDGSALITELGIVEGQWFEILARKSRLSAERDGLEAIAFDPELIERGLTNKSIAGIVKAQEQQFEARLKLNRDERDQLDEQKTQIAEQNVGLESLRDSTRLQIDLLSKEITSQEALLRQGLTEQTKVLTPQRELARLRGTEGQVQASLAENRGKIAEIEVERLRLASEFRDKAITELRELEFREIELRERRRDLKDRIAKLDLRAPVSGVVYGSTADTIRGVIRAGDPVMYVVPKNTPLVVRAHVEPIHIDQVHVGQEATLRFSAFDARTTPEVSGTVKAVSADAFEDRQRGTRYYRADIEIDATIQEKLGNLIILPGMPVEAFIRTEDRSAWTYLTKPLTTYFTRAFREG